MNPEDHELIEFAAGLADPDSAERIERWLGCEPRGYERLGAVIAAASQDDSGLQDLNVEPCETATGRWAAAVDQIVESRRRTSPQAGSGRIRWALAAAALVALSLVGLALQPGRRAEEGTQRLAAQLCEMELTQSRLPHQTALGCGEPGDALLGIASAAGLVEIRDQLDALSDPANPQWLAARTMAALLEGDDAGVIRLVEARLTLEPLPAAFYADLALAYRRTGQEGPARDAIARARRDAVGELPPGVEGAYR